LEHGWHKKAHAEARRSLALDRTSMDGWALLITCTIAGMRTNPNYRDDLQAVSFEAVEAVKIVKTDAWKKIMLHTYAFIAYGIEKIDIAWGHLQEILRLVREGGRKGQAEDQHALEEILRFIPSDALASFYPALKELAALLPGIGHTGALIKLDDLRLSFEIEGLVKKGFHEIFRDLFRILIADFVDAEDECEIVTIECILNPHRNSRSAGTSPRWTVTTPAPAAAAKNTNDAAGRELRASIFSET
jgi:hypothetical protein